MTKTRRIDINADLGEGYGVYRYGADDAIIPHITSANVAAGFHASDPITLRRAVHKVVTNGVRLGAHIGYPDPLGFGRRSMRISAKETYAYTVYQMGAVNGFASVCGGALTHIKLHGAMYMDACVDQEMAEATVRAVKDFGEGLCIYTLPGSLVETEAQRQGVEVWTEFFADRPYQDGDVQMFDWSLSELGSPQDAAARTVRFLDSEHGERVRTVCVHSDTPDVCSIVQAVRSEVSSRYGLINTK